MKDHKPVVIWLSLLCLMILGTLVVGGLTRLTDSGLSMVDWHPITGIIPPLSEYDWFKTFEQYKQFPEFIKINYQMTLAEFKMIFMWEYLHRILARSLSIVFLIPWIYFILTKKITRRFASLSFVGFLLGGSQGLLGWYMVKSGLVDKPDVSHYRLAAHLSLAIFIYAYFLWLILDLVQKKITTKYNYKLVGIFLIILTSLQIIYGAFTAGLKAGHIYNTFPKMNGSWLPEGLMATQPWFLNLFENPGTVQFLHRGLAYILVLTTLALLAHIKLFKNTQLLRYSYFILTLLSLQFILGVTNLVLRAPVHVAIVHQFGAVAFLTSLIIFTHKVSR